MNTMEDLASAARLLEALALAVGHRSRTLGLLVEGHHHDGGLGEHGLAVADLGADGERLVPRCPIHERTSYGAMRNGIGVRKRTSVRATTWWVQA